MFTAARSSCLVGLVTLLNPVTAMTHRRIAGIPRTETGGYHSSPVAGEHEQNVRGRTPQGHTAPRAREAPCAFQDNGSR